jgi:DNA polymerase elongation subunit (family B)
MLENIPKEQIKGYECKHAIYRAYKPKEWEHGRKASDVVLIKENVHLVDGTVIPNVRLIHNYKREFWVTQPGFQKHADKKEWELESRCIKKTTTQVNLTSSVALAFGRHSNHLPLRKLARSPYLYGCDVTTPVLLKQFYKSKWPDAIAKSTVAVLDIETDVCWGTEEIISVSLTYQNRSILAVTKKFLGTTQNPEEKIQAAFAKYMKDIIAKRNIKLEVVICDTPGEMCKRVIDKAHEWKPDIVSIWNIAFDLPKIIDALQREGYDLGEVFSDPCVPKEYRTASWIMDNAIKVTQSGKSTPKHPADLWHTMDCMASFYFMDSMASYKKIRAAKGNEASYSLDYILNKVLKMGKLNIDGVEGDHTLAWHIEMQRDYKIEYLIYNQADCIFVEMLDEKTNDLAIAVGQICNVSEYRRFPSIPRRTVDNLHFFCRERGLVIGTTSDEMTDENDEVVIGMNGIYFGPLSARAGCKIH